MGGEEGRRKRRGVEKKEGKEGRKRTGKGRFSHHDMYRRQDCSAARCNSKRSS
jgi:hypothetical protein